MKKIRQIIALTAIMAMCGTQVQAQEFEGDVVYDSPAYDDSGRASYLSAALPIGALVVAAIIIATTGHHHHHHHSTGGGSSSSSSYHTHNF